jgi:hypothetical protein
MSFFNKIQVTFLNFAQKVVTITTGADIGINNILQIIEANFDDIKRIFDPSIAGGGLKGENIQDNTITSDKVNLSVTKAVQGGNIINDVLRNGTGNFSPVYPVCNTVINIKGTQNKNILITSSMQHTLNASVPNNLCNIEHLLQISKVSSFASIEATKLLTTKALDNGNGIWTNQETMITETYNLPPGLYYVRNQVWADGNTGLSFVTKNSTLSIVQL